LPAMKIEFQQQQQQQQQQSNNQETGFDIICEQYIAPGARSL